MRLRLLCSLHSLCPRGRRSGKRPLWRHDDYLVDVECGVEFDATKNARVRLVEGFGARAGGEVWWEDDAV